MSFWDFLVAAYIFKHLLGGDDSRRHDNDDDCGSDDYSSGYENDCDDDVFLF